MHLYNELEDLVRTVVFVLWDIPQALFKTEKKNTDSGDSCFVYMTLNLNIYTTLIFDKGTHNEDYLFNK